MSDTALPNHLEEFRGSVDQYLLQSLHGESQLYQAARHLPNAGGKRIRPAVTILTAEIFGGDREAVIPAAAAIEATHTFTLIDDDLPPMDDDQVRRGANTVHERFGEDMAILASDLLQAKAYDFLFSTDADPEQVVRAGRVLSQAMVEICEGQQEDLAFGRDTDPSEGDYVRMAMKKTGALYGAAAQVGAILSPGDREAEKGARVFGRELGIAFQIVDAILDVTSDEIDKDAYSDLANGSPTILTIHAESEGANLSLPPDPDESDYQELVDEMRAVGSIEYARRMADMRLNNALGWLDGMTVENEEARDRLREVAQACVERNY